MIYESNLSQEPLGPLVNSSRWDLFAGSPASGLTVAVDAGSNIILNDGTGENRYACAAEFGTLNQRIELDYLHTGVGRLGILAYYQDASNYVLLEADLANHRVYLRQCKAGTLTTLYTLSSGLVPSIGDCCTMRLEVIGRRARYWWEKWGNRLIDRAPDAAVDLQEAPAVRTRAGISSSVPSPYKHQITRFAARDIPAEVMPPPHFYIEAMGGCNLTPITASVTGLHAKTKRLAWEVYAVDPDDYPEAYRDVTDVSQATRVFWVRPGFSYDVRVREIRRDGVKSPWLDFQRILAPGVKPAVSAPYSSFVFPAIAPSYVLPREQTAKVGATVSEAGREKIQGEWGTTREAFQLVFENRTAEECQTLIDFFETMRGGLSEFLWTHPTLGRTYVMRFDADDYEIRYDGHSENGSIGYMAFDIVEAKGAHYIFLDAGFSPDEGEAVDPDALVRAAAELASQAQVDPTYITARTKAEGTPLSYAEFNTLSRNVAYLSQQFYVSDGDDPDSLVNYLQVTLASDAEVTQRRLGEIRDAIRRMVYLKRFILAFGPHRRTRVEVYGSTNSDSGFETAYELCRKYWGSSGANVSDSGYTVVRTDDTVTGSTQAESPHLIATFGEATGSEARCVVEVVNRQIAFNFSPYLSATEVSIFVNSTTVPGASPALSRSMAFYDRLGSGLKRWSRLQRVPVQTLSADWEGDVIPTLDNFITTSSDFDPTGKTLQNNTYTSKPASNGQVLTISNQYQGGGTQSGYVAEANGSMSFGALTYQQCGARNITAAGAVAVAGFVVRGQSSLTDLTFDGCETSGTGGVGFLIESTHADRISFKNVNCDSRYQIIGSKNNGVATIINELVFDGCAGSIEVMGTPGSIRRCYLNNHAGTVRSPAADVDGLTDTQPGTAFIRGLPIGGAAMSIPFPEDLKPLSYPAWLGEGVHHCWYMEFACVLMRLPRTVVV